MQFGAVSTGTSQIKSSSASYGTQYIYVKARDHERLKISYDGPEHMLTKLEN